MESLGTGLALVAMVAALFAQLWVLIAAFKKSILWGLAVLLVPFISLVFIILYFSEMKYPVLLYLIAIVLGAAGGGMASRGKQRRMLEERLRTLSTQ